MNPSMNPKAAYTIGLLFAIPLVLSGCVSKLAPLPAADVPVGWEAPVNAQAPMWPKRDWWNNFEDPELTTLISSVQTSNLDLANVKRNLDSAQISLREAGYNLLPTPVVTIGTGAITSEVRNSPLLGDKSTGTNQPLTLNAGFTYNDILSKPAIYDKALADYSGRVAQAGSLALTTLGTAASTYFQLLLIRDKVVAARQNLSNAEAIGAIAQARFDAGVAVQIESLQQQIAIENARNSLRSLQQNDLSARAALALLQGRNVQRFNINSKSMLDIKVPSVQPGIPSDLLRRRPDLVLAEATLKSSNANLTIVHNSLFPQISLTAAGSVSSTALSTLVASPTSSLTISASLLETLLDNGQRFRNIDQARITLENNLTSYRKSVLAAFNDVEVQLSNIQLLESQNLTAFNNLHAAEESFREAQARYGEGVTDYQTMLQSQNTLFTARNSWLDSKLLQLNAAVGLYQALGGGWEAPAR